MAGPAPDDARLGDGADVFDSAVEDAAAEAAVEVDLASLVQESEDRLFALQRLQADFENFRKQSQRRVTDEVDRVTGRMVEELLPVLDACELAFAHGVEGIEGVWSGLLGALRKHGLEPLDSAGKPFDPAEHEAVAHEPTDDEGDPVVADVMRTGYRWKGRVLRPAMVRVRG